MAISYVNQCASSAEAAAARKHVKYAGIASTHTFVPVAMELMGPLGHEASESLTDLGWRLSVITDDTRETSHLCQRVSSLTSATTQTLFLTLFLTLGIFTTEGIKNNNNSSIN